MAVSRTDTGVHAVGMVVAFDDTDIKSKEYRDQYSRTNDEFKRAINTRLPRDVAITETYIIPNTAGFDIREHCIAKTYCYFISTDCVRPVFDRGRCWHVKEALELHPMKEFAASLVGRSIDFSAMACTTSLASITNRVCKLQELRIERAGGDENNSWSDLFFAQRKLVKITVTADRFLHNMVRILVSTLVQIGRRKLNPSEAHRALNTGQRVPVETAPAGGLTLVKAHFDPPLHQWERQTLNGNNEKSRGESSKVQEYP
mmetsp:Transcript_8199/g.17664  ORF Transcript_8199/g.17664 Transcript_8199/m.17664 type:complete len:259 (+) Transcript_8199:1-777(+)